MESENEADCFAVTAVTAKQLHASERICTTLGRVKKYSCPLCSQESSRRYNMQVHIERKHNGLTVPIDNYKPTGYHSDLVDQKVSPSRKYYAGNIRRYIAIPNSNNHSRIH
ncbi:MAG: hypothetical protein ACTHKP_16305 [Nitrososphaeraceae archaeon]